MLAETAQALGAEGVLIELDDRGAVDCIRARVETALLRAKGKKREKDDAVLCRATTPGMLLNADIYGADARTRAGGRCRARREGCRAHSGARGYSDCLRLCGMRDHHTHQPAGQRAVLEDIRAVVPLKPAMLMPTKVSSAKDIEIIPR